LIPTGTSGNALINLVKNFKEILNQKPIINKQEKGKKDLPKYER